MSPKQNRTFRRRLGDAIRARRTAKEITLTAFAEQVGVSVPTASGWEHGRYSPTLPHLNQVAEVLDCTTDDLLGAAA